MQAAALVVGGFQGRELPSTERWISGKPPVESGWLSHSPGFSIRDILPRGSCFPSNLYQPNLHHRGKPPLLCSLSYVVLINSVSSGHYICTSVFQYCFFTFVWFVDFWVFSLPSCQQLWEGGYTYKTIFSLDLIFRILPTLSLYVYTYHIIGILVLYFLYAFVGFLTYLSNSCYFW